VHNLQYKEEQEQVNSKQSLSKLFFENDTTAETAGLLHLDFFYGEDDIEDSLQGSRTESIFTESRLRQENDGGEVLETRNTDWQTGSLIFVLLLFASVKQAWPKHYKHIFDAFFAQRFISQLAREGSVFSHKGSLSLFVSFCILSGIIMHTAADKYANIFVPVYMFAVFSLLVAIVYLFKMFFLHFLGSVFNAKEFFSEYLHTTFIFNEVLAIFMFTPVLFLVFENGSTSNVFFVISVALFVLFYLFRLVRGVGIASTTIKISRFHLFLYICSLEILPMLTLIKASMLLGS